MIVFFEALEELRKRGLIDPEKDRWDNPSEWRLTKLMKKYEEEIKNKPRVEPKDEESVENLMAVMKSVRMNNVTILPIKKEACGCCCEACSSCTTR